MEKFLKTWGLYPWFEEHGANLVHPHDLLSFEPNNTRVFYCKNIEHEYLVLQFGHFEYRVKPINYKEIEKPKFIFNNQVTTRSGYSGKIVEIHWHYKDNRHYYLLELQGKKSSKRYFEEELYES